MQRNLFLAVAAIAVILGAVLFVALRPKPVAGTDPITGARFVVGSPNAKTTVVEFSNYLCPYCQQHSNEVLPVIVKDYVDTGKIKYIFRDLQFGEGNIPTSTPIRAAEAAACMADGGKYLDYYQALYRSKSQWENLTDASLDKYLADLAGQLGGSSDSIATCLGAGKKRAGVDADIELAQKLQVNSTPTFFINGKQVDAGDFNKNWRALLDKAIAETQ